jgi:hypothetical protein
VDKSASRSAKGTAHFDVAPLSMSCSYSVVPQSIHDMRHIKKLLMRGAA